MLLWVTCWLILYRNSHWQVTINCNFLKHKREALSLIPGPWGGGGVKSLPWSASCSSRGVFGRIWRSCHVSCRIWACVDCWALQYQVLHCFFCAVAVGTHSSGVLTPDMMEVRCQQRRWPVWICAVVTHWCLDQSLCQWRCGGLCQRVCDALVIIVVCVGKPVDVGNLLYVSGCVSV